MTVIIERSVIDWPLILAIWGGFLFGFAGFVVWRRQSDGRETPAPASKEES